MSQMVNIKMIADHCGRTVPTIREALRSEGIPMDMSARRLGYRVELRKANTFLSRRYPEAIAKHGPLSLTPPSTP